MAMTGVLLARAASAVRVEPMRLPAFAPSSLPLYRLLAVTATLDALLMFQLGFVVKGYDFHAIAILAGLLLLVAFCARARGWSAIADGVELWTLWTVSSILVCVLTFMLGARTQPLADTWLAQADRWLLPGFDWPATMRRLAVSPLTMRIANDAYASIGWQPVLLIVASVICRQQGRCWTVLTAWIVTLLLVVIVFALLPGLGAYAYFGIAAADVPAIHDPTPWAQPQILTGLRDGSLRSLNMAVLDGIVTFPSFHAAAAVLLGWGFRWRGSWLSGPMTALNAVMLVSAIPIGGHYVIDILAGIAVAVAGLQIAQRMAAVQGVP